MANAKNVVGDNHKKYVYEQINIRQTILGNLQRNPEDLIYLTSNSWVKLASGVNIADQNVPDLNGNLKSDNGKDFRLNKLALSSDWANNKLAQNFILSGGVTNINGDLSRGIDTTSIKEDPYPDTLGTYGLGGSEFGLQPMPGIEKFEVKHLNKGSIKKALVSIRANNKKQFEWIEALYLRLGYSMLLEWGHTNYPVPSNGFSADYGIKTAANVGIAQEFLQEYNKGLKYFNNKIETIREQESGNYDGFVGKVINFNWEITEQLHYIINLELISYGDVIESLTIGGDYDKTSIALQDENGNDIGDAYLSTSLEKFIYTAAESSVTELTANVNISSFTDLHIEPYKTSLVGKSRRVVNQLNIFSPNTSNSTNFAGSETAPDLNYTRPIEDQGKVISVSAAFGKGPIYSFVRFKDILEFINRKCSIYNLVQTAGSSTVTPESLVQINLDSNNYCYSNGYSVSANPSQMIIRQERSLKDPNGNTIYTRIIDGAEPFHIPTDPNSVGTLVYNSSQVNDGFTYNPVENKQYSVGLWYNVYFNSNYLFATLKKCKDEETNTIKLLDFLKDLLRCINTNLGGVNKLDLRFDENLNEIIIYDEVLLSDNSYYTSNNRYDIPLVLTGISNTESDFLGLGSFVRNYGIKTEITKNLSTILSIGAQANGRITGEDASIFSKFNTGYVDRVIPKKTDSDSVQNNTVSSTETASEKFGKKWANFASIYSAYGVGTINQVKIETYDAGVNWSWNVYGTARNIVSNFATDVAQQLVEWWTGEVIDDNVTKTYALQFANFGSDSDNVESNIGNFSSFQNTYFTDVTSYSAIASGKISPLSGFIPINLNVEVDGISGIRIFDRLHVDTSFLPSNYPEALNFIVKAVNHKIQSNKWITNLETFAVPKFIDEEFERLEAQALVDLELNIQDSTNLDPSQTDESEQDSTILVPSPNFAVEVVNDPVRNTNKDREFLIDVDDVPWSACTISWFNDVAKVKFPRNASHTGYAQAIRTNRTEYDNWEVLDPATTPIQYGDIVIKNRSGNNQYFSKAVWSGFSHGDVIISRQAFVAPLQRAYAFGNQRTRNTKANQTIFYGLGGNVSNTCQYNEYVVNPQTGISEEVAFRGNANNKAFVILRLKDPSEIENLVAAALSVEKTINGRLENDLSWSSYLYKIYKCGRGNWNSNLQRNMTIPSSVPNNTKFEFFNA